MHQVLFRIPPWSADGLPIFGYGMMLFLAFIICNWLAGRWAQQEGIAKERIYDLAIWLFVGGLVGARLTYLLDFPPPTAWDFVLQFPRIWEGGIVLYGAVLGALVGYGLAYLFTFRKLGISTWKVADIIAPAAALGIGIGRIGCLLNGCCYGNVACPGCPALHFPLSAPSRPVLVEAGLQTAAGFTLTDRDIPPTVARVDPTSPAFASGLRDGDEILKADGRDMTKMVEQVDPLSSYMVAHWPRGKTDLTLTVRHADGAEQTLPSFRPLTLGLQPTQVYETISMFLIFLLLLAYRPLRRHDGELMVLFMICYGIHRFLNERLRDDPRPVGFEQYTSIFLILAGLSLAVWMWRKPVQYGPAIAPV